jgi:nitroreductase
MDFDDAIGGRRSVRDFTERLPDETVLRRIIAAAVQAPSANNRQPWRFTIVRDRALLDRLADEAKAYKLAQVVPGPDAEIKRARYLDPATRFLYNAPAIVIVSAVARDRWNTEDCTLAAQNLMLAAYEEGLGSCWIGLVQDYLNTDSGKALMGLPAECVPVAPIIVGYPVAFPQPVPRNEPEIRWVG